MKPLLSIDEWFHPEKESGIIEFGWTGKKDDVKFKKEGCSVGVEDIQEIEIAPRVSIDTWMTYEEIKHINDEHTITFTHSTSSPFVEVEAFEGIEISVGYAMHKQQLLKKVGENRYELAGTLLPGQQINVRWYKIEDSVKWINQEE
jgi:hypothetical protein